MSLVNGVAGSTFFLPMSAELFEMCIDLEQQC